MHWSNLSISFYFVLLTIDIVVIIVIIIIIVVVIQNQTSSFEHFLLSIFFLLFALLLFPLMMVGDCRNFCFIFLWIFESRFCWIFRIWRLIQWTNWTIGDIWKNKIFFFRKISHHSKTILITTNEPRATTAWKKPLKFFFSTFNNIAWRNAATATTSIYCLYAHTFSCRRSSIILPLPCLFFLFNNKKNANIIWMSYLVIAAISHDICIEKKLVLIIVCVYPLLCIRFGFTCQQEKKTSSVQNNCVCVWVYFFMNMANE